LIDRDGYSKYTEVREEVRPEPKSKGEGLIYPIYRLGSINLNNERYEKNPA
jgi:hypothetical protein